MLDSKLCNSEIDTRRRQFLRFSGRPHIKYQHVWICLACLSLSSKIKRANHPIEVANHIAKTKKMSQLKARKSIHLHSECRGLPCGRFLVASRLGISVGLSRKWSNHHPKKSGFLWLSYVENEVRNCKPLDLGLPFYFQTEPYDCLMYQCWRPIAPLTYLMCICI